MSRTRPLPFLVLAAAIAFAPSASAADTVRKEHRAEPAAAAHVHAPAAKVAFDSAPFYAGTPKGAAFLGIQKQRIARARAAIARLTAVRGTRTVSNTLEPYDEAYRMLDMAGSQAGLMEQVSPDKATREAAEKATQLVLGYVTELSLDRGVYDAIAALDVSREDAGTQYYVRRVLRDFRLAGVDKDSTTRAQVRMLNDSLVTITQEFDRDINADRTTVTCTVAELDGLPEDYIAAHKPGADGKVTLTMAYPDYIPVMTYAKSEDLRRRMYIVYKNRAYPANAAVLDRMRAARHELAGLLGFANFADLATADKMVGNAQNARDFIDRVVAASADREAREYQQLLAFKQKQDPKATVVNFWDYFYLREQLRKANYDFDSQQLRQYLPFEDVKAGVLKTASTLFGVDFVLVRGVPVWDPSVECYEVRKDGRLWGRFYLDMHPRADKYKHAAQFGIRVGVEGRQLPEAALVCNLSGGKPGDPGLCTMDDVNTFFHEFGHLMHSMCAGHGRWAGVGGISTENDFVEAPSQMLEEWMKSPEVLQTFARHWQTHEPVPASLVAAMVRAGGFGRGIDARQQMLYAGTSLGAHDRDPAGTSMETLTRDLTRRYMPFPFAEGTHFECAFNHLANYTATYYTYMWSLVIAKDLFSQFDRQHLLAPEVARRYRDTVLAPGGSKPAAELVQDFLGRPFNEQAWKKWLDADQ